MTLALQRPHLDIAPDEAGQICLFCGADGWCAPIEIFRVAEVLRRLWRCNACDQQYTTRYTPPACPNALVWCVEHEVDVDGLHWHRSHTEVIRADRNGHREPFDEDVLDIRAVLVNNVDGTQDPVVWIAATPKNSMNALIDGIGISPARARMLGALLTQFANQIEGGEPR